MNAYRIIYYFALLNFTSHDKMKFMTTLPEHVQHQVKRCIMACTINQAYALAQSGQILPCLYMHGMNSGKCKKGKLIENSDQFA